MNYLGHNEFGLNHKPWNNPINFQDLNKIDYWLEQWFLFYKNIYNKYQSYKNCYFVIYEKLTNSNYSKMLLEKINLNKVEDLNLSYFKNPNNKKIDITYNNISYENAINVYKKFINSFS
tara:strand:- start:122 stop:478 length:357 start_codon:yes stop_codon:yes gene_type:complete